MRGRVRSGIRSQPGARPVEQPNSEFRKMEKPASRLARAATRRLRKQPRLCRRSVASARRRSCQTSLRREGSDDFFEARIAAKRVPVGTRLQFAIGNAGWKLDGFLQLFQRRVLIAAPSVNRRQIAYPDRPDPGVLRKRKDFASAFP